MKRIIILIFVIFLLIDAILINAEPDNTYTFKKILEFSDETGAYYFKSPDNTWAVKYEIIKQFGL
jgi:hypothetical protein